MPNTLSIGVAYSDQAISGGSIDNSPIGATTASTIAGTTIYASSEIGYSNGAQGTVTQLTSKSTGVTLSKSSGQITMSNAALAGATAVSFILTNTAISAKDTLIVNIGSNTTGSLAGDYTTYVSYLAAGSALITLRNLSAATSYSEAVIINFAIIHGA
tara:strand:- start:212 stop:685 length:474 start_codon:yes stop_codon:yes gene_type:complete